MIIINVSILVKTVAAEYSKYHEQKHFIETMDIPLVWPENEDSYYNKETNSDF